MKYRVRRTLSCFDNQSDKLVFEVCFEEFDLELFQSEFDVSKDNPMYDSFPVKVENIPVIKEALPSFLNINWNFKDYSYFVEAIEN